MNILAALTPILTTVLDRVIPNPNKRAEMSTYKCDNVNQNTTYQTQKRTLPINTRMMEQLKTGADIGATATGLTALLGWIPEASAVIGFIWLIARVIVWSYSTYRKYRSNKCEDNK